MARGLIGIGIVAFLGCMTAFAGPASVRESARMIPVAHEVDVVVVGGSTGAVSAALAARRAGAKVFLLTRRTYLGEDMCATLRLWIEPSERPRTPLGEALLNGRMHPALWAGRELAFTYQADRPSANPHKDRKTPSLLRDGRWDSASRQSVQFNGDVILTADLGERRQVQTVHLLAYQRPRDFEVASVIVSLSDDGKNWKHIGTAANEFLEKGAIEKRAFDLPVRVNATTRHVRLTVRKTQRAGRILLGEVVFESALPAGAPPKAERIVLTPGHIKRTLDKALLDAGVGFLFGCYATDVLRDADGRAAGILMANRTGRQAVVAKVIIDATPRAQVARLAGATFTAAKPGPRTFGRVVIGGRPRTGADLAVRTSPAPLTRGKVAQQAFEYTLQIDMPDGTFRSFARAEQIARDRTFDPGQVDASQTLFHVPADVLKTRGDGELDPCRPAGVDGLFVLSGGASVSGESLRPFALMDLGRRIGEAAAAEAKSLPAPKNVRRTGEKAPGPSAGEIREFSAGPRPGQRAARSIPADARNLPVLLEVDVVVVGGGTSGAPAGIGAARRGARTLVLEFLDSLGGVGTVGMIGRYYHGYRKGFTAEVDKAVRSMNADVGVIAKAEWWRRELRRHGAEIWFGVLGCGAYVLDGRVAGVVVATPSGRGVVLAHTVIDATGNADVAAAAGTACMFVGSTHVAVQGTGLSPRRLGAGYINTDYTFADDGDVVDTWQLFCYARQQYGGAYDVSTIVNTRERRRIVGEFVLTPLDQINRRRHPDTVAIAKSNFDSHGFTVHPIFTLSPPHTKGLPTDVPYRCLLPKKLEGILVVGLGISAHRDAMPLVRMQPDVQNLGYAAGVAAAMAAEADVYARDIDVRALQKHLIEIGSLPKRVLEDTDSYPLSADQIAAAVRDVAEGHRGLAVILSHPAEALPLLRAAHAKSDAAAEKLNYARALAMLADATGVETLIAELAEAEWDTGWNFRGMGQFRGSLSPLDGTIIALGRTKDTRGLRPVLRMLFKLDATKAFSHHRAVAVALTSLGDASAAKPLAELLGRPSMQGYAVPVPGIDPSSGRLTRGNRNSALRELILARALFRCGDHDGLGERILRQYARDVRGPFARHAAAVLADGPSRKMEE